MISLNAGDDKKLVFKNSKSPELTIYKEDSVAGAPVEGARFHVTYTSNGEAADAPATIDFGEFLTDSNGEIRLHEQGKRLYPGEYTITEVEPAPGFQMVEPTTQKIILHGGEKKTVKPLPSRILPLTPSSSRKRALFLDNLRRNTQ